jgi:hypothetical protein
MENTKENTKENPVSGFTDVFLSKLKEQSFLIILMLGVIYYQHKIAVERVEFWQKQYERQETYIKQREKEDREELLKRIDYLQNQRDIYVEDAVNELKNKK